MHVLVNKSPLLSVFRIRNLIGAWIRIHSRKADQDPEGVLGANMKGKFKQKDRYVTKSTVF
jgi:hypothetical protein